MPDDYLALAQREAAAQGVDPALVLRVLKQESAGNPTARSPKGAIGLMQLMPETAKGLGVNPNDPAQNIKGGVQYLKQMLDRYQGDTSKALAAYNAGPGAVDKYGGVPPYAETQRYVQNIGGTMPQQDWFAAQHTDGGGDWFSSQQPTPTEKHGTADYVAGALPSIGGLAGSVVPGGGIVGSALGGAAGQGYGELLKHATEIPKAVSDVARNVFTQPKATFQGFLQGAKEGATNAAIAGGLQGAAEGVGKYVINPVAKGAYAVAMRPLQGLRNKYGLKTLIDAGFENKILPTKGGAAKAGKLMQASKAQQEGMAAAYDAAGKPPLDVFGAATTGLKPSVEQALAAQAATGAGGGAATKIGNQVANVLQENGSAVPAARMAALKHAADNIADPAYVAARRTGGYVEPGSEAAIAKGFSKGYRQTLNDAIGPEYAQQGRTTKTLYGVGRMADYASERPEAIANLFALAGGAATSQGDFGKGLTDAVKYRLLLSPRVQAGAALLAPQVVNAARGVDAATGGVTEQALRDALMRALSGDQNAQ